MALPNLTDLKAHLNYPSTDESDDTELQDVLDAAIEVAEGIVGPLTAGAVTEVHRNVSSGSLILRRTPATALTAISARYSLTDSLPLTVEEYELDPDTGIVTAVNGSRFYGTYVVEYTAGRSDVPASIRLGVLIVAAHLWETQRRPGFTSATPAGFGGSGDVPDVPVGSGFAIPARAEELFARYRVVSIA